MVCKFFDSIFSCCLQFFNFCCSAKTKLNILRYSNNKSKAVRLIWQYLSLASSAYQIKLYSINFPVLLYKLNMPISNRCFKVSRVLPPLFMRWRQLQTDLIWILYQKLSTPPRKMGSFLMSNSSDSLPKLKSEQLQAVAEEFRLENFELHKLYQCFASFQTKAEAYLTLDDLAKTLYGGYLHFSQMPYLQRLFKTISRKTPGKLFFQDYLTGVSTYCLMSNESVLHFVFDWLDQDGDGQIDKEDIMRALNYQNPITNRKTFLSDFVADLDRSLKQNQQFLKFQEFRQLSSKLLFLIWPAYELQRTLRQRNLGVQFWEEKYIIIQKAEQIQRKNENRSARMLQKVAKLLHVQTSRVQAQTTLFLDATRRMAKQASTDLQLLQSKGLPRRRSCPYIRTNLLASSEDIPNETTKLICEQQDI